MHYKSVKYYSMKKLLYLFLAMFITIGLNACSPDDNPIDDSDTETPENPNPDEPDDPDTPEPTRGKTLIVYYSFTNNVHTVINDLGTQIEADVIRVEPTEKGIDYAANNYAIGSAQIQAIRNNMAAPLQTFLFNHGAEMTGKRIGLIVSSASSGISNVESDAKRLIPNGNFLTPSLWIRSSQTSNCHSIITEWLKNIGYTE